MLPFLTYSDNELDTNFPVREGHTPPSGPDLVDLDVLNHFDLDIVGNYCTRLRQMDLWQPLPDDQLIKVCDKVLANGTVAFTVYTSPVHLLTWLRDSRQPGLTGWAKGYCHIIQQLVAEQTKTSFEWVRAIILSDYEEVVKEHHYLQTNQVRLQESYDAMKQKFGWESPQIKVKAKWELTWEEFLAEERETGKLSVKHTQQNVRSLMALLMDYGIQHKLLAVQSHLDSKPVFLNHLEYYGYSDVAEGLMGGGGAYFLHQDYQLFHVETWIC